MATATVHKEKAKKLKPSTKIIPWTVTGKGLIFVSDHIYLLMGGTLFYLYRRYKTRR